MDPYISLQKFRRFGLGGSILKVIASYLQSRMEQIKIGISFSEELSITSGVPKGFMLAPLLVLAFIDDPPEYCTCYLFLFANDLQLAESSLVDLQNHLWSLFMWSNENKLSSNFEKTMLLKFSK